MSWAQHEKGSTGHVGGELAEVTARKQSLLKFTGNPTE